ncbi:MAG: acetaldehyde dehydrogenase (acetylating) [Chloroflexota bacterium]|nr:acetaldehyde dehydrogenase (acetylating) [Chloroflexota bacterium]MDE2883576.1 acetaldehyde dehydrogenase (acetylating) [Chloroflexota bacterium]
MADKVRAAIIGSGNIGTDLMLKLEDSEVIELTAMVGIDPESEGLAMARARGITTTADGFDGFLDLEQDVDIVFEATSAKIHAANAPRLKELGKLAIDMTPAAVGPYVVPYVNFGDVLGEPNVNLITCGGQATIPIVAAVSRVSPVRYAEIVATTASKSAGPGTRQNIDEFTRTTADGVVRIGGAGRGKAIIILNPADPPITMRNTVYTQVEEMDREAILESIRETVDRVQSYVPGYRLRIDPVFYDDYLVTTLEVEGAGMYLPKYAGNLDIMTAAAKAVGEQFARHMLGLPTEIGGGYG